MPEEFDPSWEYYEPGEEIAEIFAASAGILRNPFSALQVEARGHTIPSLAESGFTRGRGDPNKTFTRVGKERTVRGVGDVHIRCKNCRQYFKCVEYKRQRYCSTACFHEAKPRPIPVCEKCGCEYVRQEYWDSRCSGCKGVRVDATESKPCAQCHALFKPDRPERQFCGLVCFHASRGVTSFKPRKPGVLLAPRVCTQCSVTFKPTRHTQVFCTRKCYGDSKRVAGLPPKPCKCCGATYTPEKVQSTYCSVRCARRGSGGGARKKAHANYTAYMESQCQTK